MRTLALAALLLVPSLAHAADAEQPGEKSVALFDGKTLDGWKVEKCEVEVRDGCIFLKGGNGWMHTEKQYGDFVLELEWKALKTEAFDSGVYIRAEERPEKANWPARNQINLRQDLLGNIKEIKEAVARPEMAKPGEWNQMRVAVIGTTATLELNGKPAWKIDGLKRPRGYIGLQCEVPAGGQFLFRNIRITTATRTAIGS
jgi:hypothetical protein